MLNRFILCIIFHLPYISTVAQELITISDALAVTEAQPHATFFIDKSSSLTIFEIEAAHKSGKFGRLEETVPNFSATKGTIWFRLQLTNLFKDELYLNFPELFLEQITIYTRSDLNTWNSTTTGYGHPYSSRALMSSSYTVKMPDISNEVNEVVYGAVSCHIQSPIMLVIEVGTEDAINSANRRSEFISMIVLGVLLVMLLYNFCLSIVVNDRLFLYYCIYIFASIFLVLWFGGFLFEWLWPNSPQFNPYTWALGPFYLIQLWFVNTLLQLKDNLKVMYRLSYFLYAVAVLVTSSSILPHGAELFLTTVIVIMSNIYFISCAVMLVNKKIRIAYIFLIGWVPFLTVTILNTAMAFDVITYNVAFEKHGIELTLAWEVVIFSLVLGYRYNNMRQENFHAQNENTRITHEQKTLLRKMVFEQTEEIMSQNDQLLRNQEEIKLQNERLETQNKAYERLKELILKQNHQLESSVQKRTLQLAHSNEELKRHLHQVEQFSFISAHNLRAPVARILGLASIFDKAKVVGKENLTILEKLVVSAKDLDMIIHDLGAILDTQKNSSEKKEAIDVKELLYKILNRYEAEVGKEGIQIAINADAQYVSAIPAYMDSILSNLISNSIKYRTDVRLPLIKITTEELPSTWQIEIEDNGLGFDSKLFSRKLFEPFQRFHTHKEGKGLGMFLVKTQVTAMQGTITVDSEQNKGTRVRINLPKRA
jgi:two-component system, sensor histidine kinase LadS